MSIDDENVDESEGVKNLRKQYDAQKKQNEELAAKVAAFEQRERKNSVAGILKAKGVPESAASLYNGDDVSEDAVGKWLENYADVFQIKQSNTNDANLQEMQRVSSASFGDLDVTSTDTHGQVLGSPDELERAMRSLPYEELVKRGYVPKPGNLFT